MVTARLGASVSALRARLQRWERRGELAALGTWRGVVWSVVIALGVFQLSGPRKLIPDFLPSFAVLAVLTMVALLLDRRSIRFPRVPWTVVLFLSVCAASVIWSVHRSNSARMTMLYAVMALMAAVWVAQTDIQVLLRGVAWGGLLIVFSVAVFLLIDPVRYGSAFTGGIEAVLGPYVNRNSVSYALALTLPAALMRKPGGRPAQIEAVVTVIAQVAGLLVTPSSTGRGTVAVLAVSFVVAKGLSQLRGRQRVVGLASAGAVLLVLAVALAMVWEQVVAWFGKSPDISGRIPLWSAIVDTWRERPITGFGFGVIWTYAWLPLGRSRLLNTIEANAGYAAGQGHNVLFDLLPQLGVLGVIALAVLMGGLAVRGVAGLHVNPIPASWALLTFVALLATGTTEIGLLRPLGWFVVVAATAACRSRLGRDPAVP